jgi:anthranilate/para-aminobenzoate synthase component I
MACAGFRPTSQPARYQAVLSQRFDVDVAASPFDSSRCDATPPRYMFFIRAWVATPFGRSVAEMSLRGTPQMHPIAGTAGEVRIPMRISGWLSEPAAQ